MTEAEALDMAARAAGWRDWKEAHERTWELDGMRAHAATIMENAALEAKLADVSKALMATAEAAASSAKKAVEAEAKLAVAREALEENAALKAENERLRGWLQHRGGPLCMARYYSDAECNCGLTALIKEIEGD